MAVDLYMLVLNKEAINQGMKSVVKTCMEIGTFLIYLIIHQNVFRDFDNLFIYFNTVSSSSFLRNNSQRGYTTRETNTKPRAPNTTTTPNGEKTEPKGYSCELEIKNLYLQN
jgi:hypothetical protein